MNKWHIKGSCEQCGYRYEGTIHSETKSFPDIKCPNCGKETHNFDDAREVDAVDMAEDRVSKYNVVKF